jgi:hypothetical protein
MPYDTDAWAFLNIRNPLCAWATYRGALLTPPKSSGHISVWYASVLKKEGARSLRIETILERCRAQHYPLHLSRLRGMFCFRDIASAEKALAWGAHFKASNLAELSTWRAKGTSGPYDARWIGHADTLEDDALNFGEWPHLYWSGEPAPDGPPIWESLIEGELNVLGTDIRERAYALIKKFFPDSLMLLEISRLAAWVGSTLGNVAAFLLKPENSHVRCTYLMDMRDANRPILLEGIDRLKRQGHPINWADMKEHLEAGNFGKTMDLRPLDFTVESMDLPVVPPAGHLNGILAGRFAEALGARLILPS